MGGIERLGLLGGTFDPPHLGHLILAETAREQLGLERVLFLPAGQPVHKEGEPVTSVQHRVAMTRLATGDNPAFTMETIDVSRPAPHYTASLLPRLADTYPGYELWLLLGGDSLRDFPTWHQPGEIITRANLAVLPRPGAPFNWDELEPAVPGIEAATTLLDGPSLALSSTRIRAWAAGGRSLRYLVPARVWLYIRQANLYRQEAGQEPEKPAPNR